MKFPDLAWLSTLKEVFPLLGDKGAKILPAASSLCLTGLLSQGWVSNSEKPAARSVLITGAVIRGTGAVLTDGTQNRPSGLSFLRRNSL